MKVLVTGGLGFIGHNVVRYLETMSHECVITDNKTTYGVIPQHELDFLIAERRKKISTDRIYTIDIFDRDGIAWLINSQRPDVVIHLASFPRQKVVNNNPQWGSRSMSEGLLNLLEASAGGGVKRFVYISSSMVYGNFDDHDPLGISESHPTNPMGAYGIMKLAGEWLVRDYTRRTGMAHTIIRPSAVYGPLDVTDRVVSKFLHAVHNDGVLIVNGPEQVLDFTHVDDVSCGIAQASVAETASNQTYNLTRGRGRTLREAAETCMSLRDSPMTNGAVFGAPDPNFPSRGALNISSAVNDFSYAPGIDIEQGFEDYYGWLKHSFYGS